MFLKDQSMEEQNQVNNVINSQHRLTNAKITAKKWVKTWSGIVLLVLLFQFVKYLGNENSSVTEGLFSLLVIFPLYVVAIAIIGFVVGWSSNKKKHG